MIMKINILSNTLKQQKKMSLVMLKVCQSISEPLTADEIIVFITCNTVRSVVDELKISTETN